MIDKIFISQKRRSARQTGKRKKYLDDIDLHLSDEETTPQMASVLADISMDTEGRPGSSNVSIMGADEVAGVGKSETGTNALSRVPSICVLFIDY